MWSRVLAQSINNRDPPTALNGLVYITINDELYAIRASDGTEAWKAGIFGTSNTGLIESNRASPVVTGDTVYVSTYCKHTFAFNAATGAPIWQFDYAGECGPRMSKEFTLVLHNNLLYVPGRASGEPAALDARTGSLAGAYYSTDTPAFYNNLGYFLKDGALQAVDLRTSAASWSFTGDGGLQSSPVIASGILFARSDTGNLYTLDAISGSPLYTSTLPSSTLPYDNRNITIITGMGMDSGKLVVPVANWLVVFGNGTPVPTHTPLSTPTAVRIEAPGTAPTSGNGPGATGRSYLAGLSLTSLVSLVVRSLVLVKNFFLPYLIASALALTFAIITSWRVIKRRVALHGVIAWLALNTCGSVVLVMGLCVGLVAYEFSKYLTADISSGPWVSELRSANGRLNVFALLLISSVATAGIGAAGGAIQAILFWNRFRRVAPLHWVSANARFWSITHIGSLSIGLIAGLALPGVAPSFIVGVGGVIGGLFAGARVGELAAQQAVDEDSPVPEKSEYYERLVDTRLPQQGDRYLTPTNMAIMQARSAPSSSSLLGFAGAVTGAMALVIVIPTIVIFMWAQITKPHALTPQEVIEAGATATTVSLTQQAATGVATGDSFAQQAKNYLASGNKQLHDEYQRDAIGAYDNVIELNPE